MDLKTLINWAKQYDINSIDQKGNKRVIARNYFNMIIQKGKAIFELEQKQGQYMKDIEEYVSELEKKGIKPYKGDPDNQKQTEGKPSPLLP